ncbi:3-oxoacyl-[acyl-carrier protein] reductase [Raoultella sp. BIGb0149]|uniref:3-oxoacyl-ACP reductase family protein n=1 Tax=Raoultella TaxID=160674 RepID=UPI00105DC2D7|nr:MULTISPECIES: 3-oxoacyl-ACP reductase family protein [Raoultella]MCI1030867.1 3-oxoacyl-ACP reductase FabG [Raoultella terrigena]TDQ24806.1 3-oxoacyl-[acyl-carrier protein] reductase [Raoultella sp. BIGb0149]
MKNQSHSQKVALVFGGSRGIGAAAAKRLAQDGFAVALTYISSPDKAGQVVEEITAAGGQAFAIAADSASAEALQRAVALTVERFGPLDAAVVNAGIIRVAPLSSFSLDDLDAMLDVNIRGVFLAIQAATAQMNDGGRVITMGSNTAVRSFIGAAAVYAMTKAAVAGLVKGLALDLAPRRITVNNVQPGPTETDITADMVERLAASSPLQRIAQPEEIASLVSWLAGSESGYMTGSSLTIDGGLTA